MVMALSWHYKAEVAPALVRVVSILCKLKLRGIVHVYMTCTVPYAAHGYS